MMTEQTTPKTPKAAKQAPEKTPIGRLTLPEVDAALADCEKTIKSHSDTVKAKLGANASIPSNVLRELSRANAQKGRLMMRRIALLIDAGDAAVMDLLDKLMKVKPAKVS
jgi:hypothetical protein